MLHRLGVQIFRPEHQLSGIQQLRADDSEEELFKGHAVISEKATQGEGERRQDADPADLPVAQHVAQAEVQPHRHQDGQQGKQELPQGQAEKQAFLIVPDFFVDADFYKNHLRKISSWLYTSMQLLCQFSFEVKGELTWML